MNADRRPFRLLAMFGALVLGVAAIYVALQGNWTGTLVLSAFLALSIFVIVRRSRLPTLFEALFVAALLMNAAGYAWSLWYRIAWYDEVVHLYTSFAITLALGFMLYEELMDAFSEHRAMFVFTITSLGLALGAGWEIVEWFVEAATGHEMIRGLQDTISDLIFDLIGALSAAIINVRGLREKRQ